MFRAERRVARRKLSKNPEAKREEKGARMLAVMVKGHTNRKWTTKTTAEVVRRYKNVIEQWKGTYTATRAAGLLELAKNRKAETG